MNPIQMTVTGHLGEEPRPFQTKRRHRRRQPAPGPRGPPLQRFRRQLHPLGQGHAFGALARQVAESVHKGERVTVLASDITAETWTGEEDGKPVPRATIAFRAYEISASMLRDNLTTGYAERKAAAAAGKAAGADGQSAE